MASTNRLGEDILNKDSTIPINDPEFKLFYPKGVALKWMDPIHLLAVLLLLGMGITAYVL